MKLGGLPEPIGDMANFSAPGPAGPIPLRAYVPVRAMIEPAAALVYFHGGGFVAGSLDTHESLCRALANSTGCVVVSVGYRLAPENPFPAALDDGCAAVTWILAHAASFRVDPRRIGLAGDSAGANLAAAVCQILRYTPGPKLVMQLLLCPILDFSAETESRRTFRAGYLFDMTDFLQQLKEYLPVGADLTDPRISPLCARELSGLPVTYIHTAEYDPMRDEGLRYAERLRAANIEVHYVCHAGMIHLFYALSGAIPSASAAVRRIATQIAPALTGEYLDDRAHRI
jgi:acetyl esterase/lipase